MVDCGKLSTSMIRNSIQFLLARSTSSQTAHSYMVNGELIISVPVNIVVSVQLIVGIIHSTDTTVSVGLM